MQTWKAIIHLIEMNIKVFLFTRKMLGVWLSREVYILYTHTHIYIYMYRPTPVSRHMNRLESLTCWTPFDISSGLIRSVRLGPAVASDPRGD